jgi:hypothetical protein
MRKFRAMSRMMAALLLATFVAAEASACSCVAGITPDGAFKSADAVFAGVVVSIEDPRGDRMRTLSEHERDAVQRMLADPSSDAEWGRKVTFRVMQWWKTDSLTESVVLWTGYGGGDCGYPVEAGKSYLVYSHRDSRNQLTFGICGRTAALICASEDLEKLGEPIKTYETFDTISLVKREQPYTTYWRSCIRGPLLIGDRGLAMDKHCRFTVEGVVGRDGTIRDFRIISTSSASFCPDSLHRQVIEQVAKWRFRPAELNGEPIEALLTTVSMHEPINETEYAKLLRERAEWEARKKQKE